ncbi:10022_t:CDS:2 [Scutellospora calospora]|uniref:10022_t:CDS:1 n=1 Tax=Scutellospora calospora TaxID=85575 RepID=A0ACA9L8E3_9GLOM|nr:10022_t:CDS:2 [Scutellospora calospora]
MNSESDRLSKNYIEDEFLENINDSNNIAKIDNISIGLEQIIISKEIRKTESRVQGRKRDQRNKIRKSSKRRDAISAQLPKLSDFNILVHI